MVLHKLVAPFVSDVVWPFLKALAILAYFVFVALALLDGQTKVRAELRDHRIDTLVHHILIMELLGADEHDLAQARADLAALRADTYRTPGDGH